ncbi:MAG: aminotransferase class I/II-fold pyridoxal phosphate-dependent enzyme [Nanoarchaeota archaeon]|nr:aminotransferase class I/II-fold pyridoxal phosphate-dependent enzyme [Nanoarchaeota archaeon]MBU1004264.1 aminotransferase class I/II-fold pyridoxal phosphate-dependent enzyme [Nanoarchaeota archaeon]MBU1946141.1 aminotransferase class I/II-fold pyridoxal phosphate-dependent enzyme [Nanoarchaeota archaeon]
MELNQQAIGLNETLQSKNNAVYEMLSEKGKAIFFPKKGILGQSAEAKGKRINATIGIALEDDGSPMRLKPIAKKIKLDPKDVFPYASSFGKIELREKWKNMLYAKNPLLNGKEVSLPVVTNALTHGMSMAGYMFINPGDKVIMPDLFWGNYRLIMVNAYGAVFDTFEMFSGNGFNVNGLREKLGGEIGKKIVLLNFPNNPTGYTPTDGEIVEIRDILKEAAEKGNKIIVMVDDAYFGLVYKKGIYLQSIFAELADLHENLLAVKLDGATKEDYVWGLRVGFVTYGVKGADKDVYAALENKTAGAVRGSISNDSNLSQSLVYHAFSEPNYWKEKKKKFKILKGRFDEVKNVLKEHKEYEEEFNALPYNSGYFMCIKLKSKDGEKVRQILLEKYETGVISMGNVLRIAFSSVKKEIVPELFDNIFKSCKEN